MWLGGHVLLTKSRSQAIRALEGVCIVSHPHSATARWQGSVTKVGMAPHREPAFMVFKQVLKCFFYFQVLLPLLYYLGKAQYEK